MKLMVSLSDAQKILYFDMDGVLVDFHSSLKRMSPEQQVEYKDRLDEVPGVFGMMEPMPGAVQAFHELSKLFDCYILSTAPWDSQTALQDKLAWVKKYLGQPAYKRVIFSHNKHLNRGDFLIDDRTANGADRFTGEHIHFGKPPFMNWQQVLHYLKQKRNHNFSS